MDSFEVVRPCGKGSFASVFKVKRHSDGLEYALKRVHMAKMDNKAIQDTLNEVRFLASFQHPNVVLFQEAFLDKSDMCIIMEYCGSGDLAGKVKRYKKNGKIIDERQIWSVSIQLLEGLKTLHDKRILHRDIKCANVFVCEDGVVKLGDMNVSKRLNDEGLLKTQIGTPYYMSPEIWKGKSYGSPSDMWALGCLIYELCALTVPFAAQNVEQLRRRVLSGVCPSIPHQYTYDMSNLVKSLLQLEAVSRPSALELLNTAQCTKYRKYIPKSLDYGLADRVSSSLDLLQTIRPPPTGTAPGGGFSASSSEQWKLPEPRYALSSPSGSRPSSPIPGSPVGSPLHQYSSNSSLQAGIERLELGTQDTASTEQHHSKRRHDGDANYRYSPSERHAEPNRAPSPKSSRPDNRRVPGDSDSSSSTKHEQRRGGMLSRVRKSISNMRK